MAEKTKPSGDNEVGYGNPPKEHQFKPGQSGNIKGRPKSRKSGLTDVSGLLNEPVKVKAGGKVREMGPFEAGLWKLAKRAVDKDLRAILRFVKICEEYGAFAPPSADTSCGVVRAPKGVNFHEWLESVTEDVPIDEA